MNKLYQLIAKLGQNANFVAFMAHSGIAATVLLATKGNLWVAIGALIVAGIKEFYFDMKYETTPPQTFTDSLEDFVGYFVGIVGGVLLSHL